MSISSVHSGAETPVRGSEIGIYTIGKEIGKGSFATVYKCINNKTHESVAIKSVVRSKLKSKKLIENLEIEISILKTMKHPHIVGLLDYNQTSTHFHLVMDYCSMGDLSYFIRRRNQLIKTHPVISSVLERYPSPPNSHGLNQTLVIHFLKQLASALEFLRDKSLVHRDIKPQNLLLCPPLHSKEEFQDSGFAGLWDLPILKIADFGFARFLPSTSMAETLCGSPLYMAPEILRYEKYNAKADIWSVGAVLYEMAVGRPPFKAANHIELLKNIEKSNDRIKFPSSAEVPDSLKRLIKSLLKYNPTERISFNEFFNDPLIVTDLVGNDEPLETSRMDENLFISEYISPLKPAEKANYFKPIGNVALEQHRLQSAETSSSNSESRDEEIKRIITKNSPGPETITHSIQQNSVMKASGMKNKDDIILEKDYVVVEKRAVEVNAIADELANAGSGVAALKSSRDQSNTGSSKLQESKQLTHRRTSLRSNSSGSQRRPSISERRISISISPTSALSKAIGMASNRLFGSSPNQLITDLDGKGSGNVNNALSTVISSPDFANNLLLQKLNLPTSSIIATNLSSPFTNDKDLSPDEVVLRKLESITTKAHAVNLFADVKFSQLIPSPPSSDGYDDDIHQTDLLPPKIVKSISEEGVVLYVKTLSLLAKGMSLASDWWYSRYESEKSGELKVQNAVGSSSVNVSVKINELVQWIREKFNECLEKAEFIRLRLQEAESFISQEAHDNPSASSLMENPKKVIAEKLIFERALEMSRNAAVNELVKEDLKGCELAYSTAIWMLEALLDDDITENDERLDEEDRIMVEKFIISVGNRLSVLRKKLELNQSKDSPN